MSGPRDFVHGFYLQFESRHQADSWAGKGRQLNNHCREGTPPSCCHRWISHLYLIRIDGKYLLPKPYNSCIIVQHCCETFLSFVLFIYSRGLEHFHNRILLCCETESKMDLEGPQKRFVKIHVLKSWMFLPEGYSPGASRPLRRLESAGISSHWYTVYRLDQVVEGSGMGLFLIGGHWLKILLQNSKGTS